MKVEDMLVISESLEVVKEGMSSMAPCDLTTSTVQEPLQGLQVEGADLTMEADQGLTALPQGAKRSTSSTEPTDS